MLVAKTNAGFPQSDSDGAATGPGSAIHRALVSGRWSTFGPHAIGVERFATVSSGPSFVQVAGGILGKQARVENPDKTPMARGRHEGMRIGHARPSSALVRQSPLVRAIFFSG
jgi:hypothetical protein